MGDGMRDARRGAAGISAVATADGVDIVGWCDRGLDPAVVSDHIRAELRRTRPQPGDLVDDFDYVSIWCGPAGEVEGGMQLRTRPLHRPLGALVAAADAWLAQGGLAKTAGPPDR